MQLRTRCLLLGLLLLSFNGLLLGAQDQNELSRRVIALEHMSGLAKETYIRAIGANRVGTINEVLYRGVPVMCEIDQQMDRRRVEIVIRYDGERVPIGQVKRPKEIDKKKIEAAKLPDRVATSVNNNIAQDTVEEVREIRYRDTVIMYEVDAAELCYGFFVNGDMAFKAARPATQPVEPEQGEEDEGAGADGDGEGSNSGHA